MAILSRFKDIMSSNINALLDKCEDPAKMVDQQLRNMREALAEVKQDTAAVMADEKAAERRLNECKADIQKYQTAAQNAVMAGQDDDARKLISKKQMCESNLASLQNTYDVAKSNSDKLRQLYDKLVSDIDLLESRKDNIKATVNVAKAQERVNKMTDGARASDASMAAFERMEAKANKMLDTAMAGAELSARRDEDADTLAAKYANKGGNASVEAELAAMRANMMGGQNQ